MFRQKKSKSDITRTLAVLSLTACLLGVGESHAQGTQLLAPVEPAVMFQDGSSGLATGRAGYYFDWTYPAWTIAQWGIQQNVAPAWGASSGWSVANQYARVQFYPQIDGGQNVYELAQANNSPCGHERDLFLQTADPGFVVGTSPGMTRSAELSNLGSIRVDVGLNISYQSVTATCGGGMDYSQYVYSIILASTSGQTLFYQVNLGRSSDPGQNSGVNWCPDYENADHAGYCLDDDVRNLGGSWVSPYNNVVNGFDFLPRILQVVKAGHQKAGAPAQHLDQDPSHWTMGAVYVGEVNQGGAISTSRWYNLGLRTYPGGTFCNGSHTVQWSCYAGQPVGTGWVDVGSGCYHRDTGLSCF